MNSYFLCSRCEKTLPVSEEGGTGYVNVLDSEDLICYDCQGLKDAGRMLDGERMIMYFIEGDPCKIVNWPGTLQFIPFLVHAGTHNIAKIRIDAWFIGPDGCEWHGICIGDSQLMRVNRLKRQRANSTPLDPSRYIKQYKYNHSRNEK
jgi:hypothetical protein